MNAVIERARDRVRQERESETKQEKAAREGTAKNSFTQDVVARIIGWLNAKEADELKAKFHQEQRLMLLAVKHGREIPTKPAPWGHYQINPFR